MRICYLNCHKAGLCCYLVIHIENLLHPLQLFLLPFVNKLLTLPRIYVHHIVARRFYKECRYGSTVLWRGYYKDMKISLQLATKEWVGHQCWIEKSCRHDLIHLSMGMFMGLS
jgi:hypothetical protein